MLIADLPLKQIHLQAEIAAEASRCAGEQGKYWECNDQLFNASKLDRDALLEYASNLKLDDKQFDSCRAVASIGPMSRKISARVRRPGLPERLDFLLTELQSLALNLERVLRA